MDRDKGVIYGVKVLGRYSPNNHGEPDVTEGTEYTPGAMRDALPLYEGAQVKTDHPSDRRDADADRSVNDTFGVLRSPRLDGDSVRADLHYLKEHPLAGRVLEDVERGLGVFGLSHNAMPGKTSVRGGRYVIEKIESVRSVDLVDRPATNKNLWESAERPMKRINVRSYFESAAPKTAAGKAAVKALLEDDTLVAPDAEMPEPAAPDAGNWKQDMLAAVAKLLDSEDPDEQALVQKIMNLLKPSKPAEEPAAESEDDKDKKKDDEKDMKESLAVLRREKAARVLCESIDYRPTEEEVSVLADVADERRRRLAAERFKGAAGAAEQARERNRPRSRPAGVLESRDAFEEDSYGRATRAAKA